MKFSERKGYKPVADLIQKEGMSDELRNSLWNVLDLFLWKDGEFLWGNYEPNIQDFSTELWFRFFKKTFDTRPDNPIRIVEAIRQYYFEYEWFEVYDFLEWTLNYLTIHVLVSNINTVLERELAGYRYIGGMFTDIADEAEITLLEEAIENKDFPGVRAHLQAALRLLSNREAPDYRNSIKESISAVESMAQIVSSKPKASLGDALKALERESKLHSALKEGFSKIYGYTSNEGGIRHAMLEEPNLDAADAKFFLLSCTSFINYLKSKM